MANITLKPVEKKLLQILRRLENEAGKANLTAAQTKKLAADARKVRALIKRIPPLCKRYDMGI